MASRTEVLDHVRQQQTRILRRYLAHEIYAEILRARPDVRLDRLENESPEKVSAPTLAAAHAYQIGVARDELANHFHVDRDLPRRAPNLLIVSSNGAGYDPVDVDALRRLGVLVVNSPAAMLTRWPNTPGNAAHLVETNHRGGPRAEARFDVNRNALIGAEAQADHRHRRTW